MNDIEAMSKTSREIDKRWPKEKWPGLWLSPEEFAELRRRERLKKELQDLLGLKPVEVEDPFGG